MADEPGAAIPMAQDQGAGGITMEDPYGPKGVAAPAAAPPAAPGLNPEMVQKLEGVAAETKAAERDIGAAATHRAKAEAESLGAQKSAIDQEAEAQRRLNEDLGKPGGVLEEHAKQMAILDAAKKQAMLDQQATLAQAQQLSAQHIKRINNYMNSAPPADLWGQAGVNPVIGRLAVMFSSFGQAGESLAGRAAGPNQSLEYFKALAAQRAHQYVLQGQALAAEGHEIAQLHQTAAEDLGSRTTAAYHIQAGLERTLGAQIELLASRYKNPQILAAAKQKKAELEALAAQHDFQGTKEAAALRMEGMRTRASIYERLAAASKGNHDQKQAAAAESTIQAVQLLRERKHANPERKRQIDAILGPMLSRVDFPGSQRVPQESAREAELAKMGGIHIPFFGRYFTDEDSLVQQLIQQQQLRDRATGTAIAPQLENAAEEALHEAPPEEPTD